MYGPRRRTRDRGRAGEQARGQEQRVVLARVGGGAFGDIADGLLGRGVLGAGAGQGQPHLVR
ncbi:MULTISPECIES: hypothetical protein, partial [unclassified Streptomyces]|uniref:hypothetical protein n=1 Tax=unclassified Streptomyces TaxID=2593676 RepID=UPI001C402033